MKHCTFQQLLFNNNMKSRGFIVCASTELMRTKAPNTSTQCKFTVCTWCTVDEKRQTKINNKKSMADPAAAGGGTMSKAALRKMRQREMNEARRVTLKNLVRCMFPTPCAPSPHRCYSAVPDVGTFSPAPTSKPLFLLLVASPLSGVGRAAPGKVEETCGWTPARQDAEH